jgi:hypothetical protein
VSLPQRRRVRRIDLTVTTLRASKRAASLRVAMTQGARAILEALVRSSMTD